MLLYHGSPRKHTGSWIWAHLGLSGLGVRFNLEFFHSLRAMTQLVHASLPGLFCPNLLNSIYCRKPSWVQKHTHTHTHTHTQSLSQMSIKQQMRKRHSQVRRADLTDNIFKTLAQKPGILGRAQILATSSSQGKV